jgi:TolB-like protein
VSNSLSNQFPAPATTDGTAIKRRRKLRAAWVSFAGRIVAQIVGAAATVGFAMIVLQSDAVSRSPAISEAAPTPLVVKAVASGERPSLVVQPFTTFTNAGQHVGADALTRALAAALVESGDVSVSLGYRPASHARYVIQGAVAVVNDDTRVTAHLIDSHAGEIIWARSYSQPLVHSGSSKAEVAVEIAAEIRRALGFAAVLPQRSMQSDLTTVGISRPLN